MKKSYFSSVYYREYAGELASGKTNLPYYQRVIEYGKRDGFQGIEVLPTFELMKGQGLEFADDYKDQAKRIREKLDKEGMVCSCFSFGLNMLSNEDYAFRILRQSADVAEILGSPYVHHTFQCSFAAKNVLPEESYYQGAEKTFIDLGRAVAEYAGERGLECIYEDQGVYINTVDRLGSLMAKINMPNVGVCLDCGNSLFYDVSPETFAGAFASLVKHVHIKDYIKNTSPFCPGKGWDSSVSGVWLRNSIIGTGVVNFEKIFSILLSAGYDGFYSLENQNALDNLSDVSAIDEIRISMKNAEFLYNRAKASLDI